MVLRYNDADVSNIDRATAKTLFFKETRSDTAVAIRSARCERQAARSRAFAAGVWQTLKKKRFVQQATRFGGPEGRFSFLEHRLGIRVVSPQRIKLKN